MSAQTSPIAAACAVLAMRQVMLPRLRSIRWKPTSTPDQRKAAGNTITARGGFIVRGDGGPCWQVRWAR